MFPVTRCVPCCTVPQLRSSATWNVLAGICNFLHLPVFGAVLVAATRSRFSDPGASWLLEVGLNQFLGRVLFSSMLFQFFIQRFTL